MVFFLAPAIPYLASAVVAIICVAGASGAFDNHDVDESDYDDEGIYIPEEPFVPEIVIPVNPTVQPEVDVDPELPSNPEVNPNPNADGHPVVPAYPRPSWDREPVENLLPFGFMFVSASAPQMEDPDPDFDIDSDPSSSFIVSAEAHDSGLGGILLVIVSSIIAFFVAKRVMEGMVE